jgi:hypothetical protein
MISSNCFYLFPLQSLIDFPMLLHMRLKGAALSQFSTLGVLSIFISYDPEMQAQN